MNKKIGFIFIIMVMFIDAALFSQTLLVQYIEGKAELKKGSKWVLIKNDEEVAIDATVRLAANSLVELSGNSLHITLVSPGTYSLKEVAKSSSKVAGYGLDTMILGKVKYLLDGKKSGKSAVAGVRADKVEQPGDDVEFVYGDDEGSPELKIAIDAQQKLVEGKYVEAVKLFEEAIDSESGMRNDEWHYGLAFAYSKLYKTGNALSALRKISTPAGESFYSDYIVLYGELLVKTLAFSDALNVLTPFFKDKNAETSPAAQSVCFLTAVCHLNLNEQKLAADFLTRSVKINAQSDIGKKSSELLAQIK